MPRKRRRGRVRFSSQHDLPSLRVCLNSSSCLLVRRLHEDERQLDGFSVSILPQAELRAAGNRHLDGAPHGPSGLLISFSQPADFEQWVCSKCVRAYFSNITADSFVMSCLFLDLDNKGTFLTKEGKERS